jgi:AcrR family transcriptional regulator
VDSTRDRLVDAATELLDEGGPAAVTLREVGRRAGVSHNAPYKHFADKESLLAAIAARELNLHDWGDTSAPTPDAAADEDQAGRPSRQGGAASRTGDRGDRASDPASRSGSGRGTGDRGQGGLRTTGAGGSPSDELRRIMHAYVARALQHPARFKLTFGRWTKGSDELHAAAVNARRALLDTVERAQAAGELPPGDVERVAALVQATAHGAIDLALAEHLSPTGKGRASPADLVDDLFDALRLPKSGAKRSD